MIGHGQLETQHPEDRPSGSPQSAAGAGGRCKPERQRGFDGDDRNTAAAHHACQRPRLPRLAIASGANHTVISPRWTSARSYAGQFPTWYFVLYFGMHSRLHVEIMRLRPSLRWPGAVDEPSFPRTTAVLRAAAVLRGCHRNRADAPPDLSPAPSSDGGLSAVDLRDAVPRPVRARSHDSLTAWSAGRPCTSPPPRGRRHTSHRRQYRALDCGLTSHGRP